MPTYTVTADVADFDTGGAAPRLAFATFARASIDATTGEIITTAPQSVQLTATPGTIRLEQGVPYRVRLDGVPGVTSPFYVSWTADCTLAALYQSHQVDPSSLAPLPTYPSIASQIAALQSSVGAITQGAPGAYDTFLEVATQFGLDEATVTALQALVAGKAASSALTAEVTRATAAEGANATAITARALALTTTAVKTANYTAAANEIVPADTTAGTFTVTLPTAPADKTRVIVKLVASAATPNPLILALGGSDVFNKTGGSTTGSLSLLNQAIAVQYTAPTGIWTVTGDDLPLSQLDARFLTPAAASATYPTFAAAAGTAAGLAIVFGS